MFSLMELRFLDWGFDLYVWMRFWLRFDDGREARDDQMELGLLLDERASERE